MAQGDEPLVDPAHIDALVAALAARPGVGIAACAAPLRDEASATSPHVTKVVFDAASYAIYFSRALIPHSKRGCWSAETAYWCARSAVFRPALRC